jgi:hypothetical protein
MRRKMDLRRHLYDATAKLNIDCRFAANIGALDRVGRAFYQ